MTAADRPDRVHSGAPWEEKVGYCRAVRAGDWVLVAGTTSTADARVAHPGDPYAQTRTAFGIALQALAELGGRPEQVVRTRMYVVSMADQADVGRAHRELFGAIRPAATMVGVSGLADPEHLVEVEVEAYLGPTG